MNCIFCKIAQKETSAYIILEKEHFLSFLDIHPHTPGHTVVIPKDHIENFVDLPETLASEFVQAIKETILLLQKALQTSDFTLGINEGPLAGRTIPHLHFHVMPRFANDAGGSIHSVVKNLPKEPLTEIYQKIMHARES